MKSSIYMILTVLFVVWAIPAQLAAQVQQVSHIRYAVEVLSSLGGTASAAEGVNNKGWVAGDSNLLGDQTEHAVLWRDGITVDLGTLGGLNSYAGSVTERGAVEGSAETSNPDPLNENFCGLGTGLICLGYLWQEGQMTALPTLGGNNATAGGFNGAINKRGQVVGWAETATQNTNCILPQVLPWEAVIWGPEVGEVHELAPLSGDSVSGALAINENDEVVGGSGPTCESPGTAASLHAVLWKDGKPANLGSFGGLMNNLAWAINNHDQIVGFSDLANDETMHAFLWQNGSMTDLGTLPGDFLSAAYGINDKGQVVGQSCDQRGNCGSFLWQDGKMMDLNTLTVETSLYLIQPFSINSVGEIVGQAFDQNLGAILPVVAIPCNGEHAGDEECKGVAVGSGAALIRTSERPILPEDVRKQLRMRRGFGHF